MNDGYPDDSGFTKPDAKPMITEEEWNDPRVISWDAGSHLTGDDLTEDLKRALEPYGFTVTQLDTGQDDYAIKISHARCQRCGEPDPIHVTCTSCHDDDY